MPPCIGKQAVVVGAGMAGLTAARALADFFERVIVLERDALPADATPRPGTPQSKHAHGLLAGGSRALSTLFPGFDDSLTRAGAVTLRMSSDVLLEPPGYDPFPQRDLGVRVFSLTRPLLELTVRRRLQECRNIAFVERCGAKQFLQSPDGAAVGAVQCEHLDGKSETLRADFVIDASGHGSLSVAFLKSIDYPVPEETLIGVDISYATAIFDTPSDAPQHWKAAMTFPDPPRNRRAALVLPIEGNRWLLTLGGRFETKPLGDWPGFLEYSQQLRTRTIYNAIRGVAPPGTIALFGFKESRWRHFERLTAFPLGLLPFGDAICRFNPVYGQGMSVAAIEANLLHGLLTAASAGSSGHEPAGVASKFFAEAATIIQTPWISAALPDFIDPLTTGQRPADLEEALRFSAALMKLASRDAGVHKLFTEVQHLLKPRSAYRTPELSERIKAVMAESKATAN